MSRWRIAVLGVLVALPIVTLLAVGSYDLWQRGLWFYAWWPMTGCYGLAYFLAWRWQRGRKLLRIDFDAPPHWTDRDKLAWQRVEARAAAAKDIPIDKLGEMTFYVEVAQEMSKELAQVYHPGTRDPVRKLTIPEILAVTELASHDLTELVDKYLPGGHLLTVGDWQRARQATEWYSAASKVYWAVATLFNPVQSGTRFLASQLGLSKPLALLQNNVILWFYTAYLQRVGTYLIELYSGRLRVGARRYRELMAEHAPAEDGTPADGDGEPPARQVTLALFGQVKAGKSSLINAFLGEQRAKTDVLPATDAVTRYELHPAGLSSQLVLLDTVGYGHEGPKADDLPATEKAARAADILLLVLHARNPARQADLLMLQRLNEWFGQRPDLKRPPVLAVLTHIDLLTPAVEWAPPYDWRQPTRPKEQQIARAVAAVREQLGDSLSDVIPVCTAEGKVFGVAEDLLPEVARRLDEGHAVALLRCLRSEMDSGQVRKIWRQLLAAGKGAAWVVWESAQK
jgi:uncharacterized protein